MPEEVRTKVIKERDDLEGKIKRLANFIYNNDFFYTINKKQQRLLKSQLAIMSQYLDILNERLEVD